MTPRIQRSIKSIMKIAATKLARSGGQTIDAKGLFRRSLPVREQS
jgi:hypothetical protein